MQGSPQGSLAALKQYFGFDSFRPLQAEIIRDTLDGRDVLVLLPTGGGKSLCYQLPTVLADGLTVVVSPLIALMKDQVDALQAAGIPATFLNSSLEPAETRPTHSRTATGQLQVALCRAGTVVRARLSRCARTLAAGAICNR